MSSDGYFWAGMAGGRMERINKLNYNIRTWQERSAKLERIIEQQNALIRELRKSRLGWFDEACYQAARVKNVNGLFKHAQGQLPSEYAGDKDKLRKAIDKERINQRKTGIGKCFNWHL